MTSVHVKPLSAFLRKWRALPGNAYEPSTVVYDAPLWIVLGRHKARRLIVVTKDTLLSRIDHDMNEFPAHWVLVKCQGLPGRPHIEELAALSRRLRLPVEFVGDLTPFALHVFLEYFRHLQKRHIKLQWIGINQAWLTLCRDRVRGRSFDSVPIDMSPVEYDHFAAVAAAASWLEQAIGEDPWRLLTSGKVLHLEAASGVGAYGPGIHREIVKLLDRKHGRAPPE